MAQRLAVDFPGRFHGLAVVSATLSHVLSARLTPEAAVPALFIHGTEDPVIPYAGKNKGDGPTWSAEETARRWADCNGSRLSGEKEEKSVLPSGMAVTVHQWLDKGGRILATLCSIKGSGHDWPGIPFPSTSGVFGPLCKDLSASRMILDFFSLLRSEPNHPAEG
jgi:polyhydroxybutyrate depolymerase